MASVHVVGYDEENYDGCYGRPEMRREVWLVGRHTHVQVSHLTGEMYGLYRDPIWVDGSYDFNEAMDLARERDNQWNPGVDDGY